MLRAFEPIVNDKSNILVLGSMPGVESLRQNKYYAFNRNHFWKIIFKLFDEEIYINYNDRVNFLLKNNIALWDVLRNCEREGSLDSNIKNEIPNDFESFFIKYSNIKYIFFNGTTSEKLFKKYIGFKNNNIIDYIKLPSTSPAYTKPLEFKLDKWKIIKEVLNKI